MSAKQKMCTVMDLPTSILASLFAPLMLAGLPNHFPILTMVCQNIIETSSSNVGYIFSTSGSP